MKLVAMRRDLMLRGVAYLAVLAVAVALVLAQFVGAFADRVTVTARLTETGDALTPGSDVKMRGVLVGRVGHIRREMGSRGRRSRSGWTPARHATSRPR